MQRLISPPHSLPERHRVTGQPLQPPFAPDLHWAIFAMGCFWGAERRFWQQPGVYSTAVGYCGGDTVQPSYEAVCSGLTGHSEAVLVVFDPQQTDYASLLKVFWEAHDPTQGMRQGNDIGSQYRSAIYCRDAAQLAQALASRDTYQQALSRAGYPAITSEIALAGPFYYAEDYHQQYLDRHPQGYCGLRGSGVAYP